MKQPSSHRTQLYNNGHTTAATTVAAGATPPTPPTPTPATPSTPPTPPSPRTPPTPPTPSSSDTTAPGVPHEVTIIENATTAPSATIAARAYELYIRSGSLPGRCEQNWLNAERELTRENTATDRRATAAAVNKMMSEGGGSTTSAR